MLPFSSQQTRWMGLAGLAGGVLWTIDLVFFRPGRIQGPSPWNPVMAVTVATLLLVGLVAFLANNRMRLGRKGTVGVSLLIVSMTSFFLLNILRALLGGEGNLLLGLLDVAYAVLPIPGFILIGVALKGVARVGASAIAIVGPLAMMLPFLPLAPRWVGESPANSPVALAYFILVAAWLAAAGYSTFRQAPSAS